MAGKGKPGPKKRAKGKPAPKTVLSGDGNGITVEDIKKSAMGRPTDYTPELADLICTMLTEGYSLNKITKLDNMPCMRSIFNWMGKYPDFMQKYTYARELQAEHMAAEILNIADDSEDDIIEFEITEGVKGTQTNHEHIQRSKLRVDTRKWLMSKLLPKKFGDITKIQHAGHDGGELGGTWIVKGVSPGDVVPIPEEDKDE